VNNGEPEAVRLAAADVESAEYELDHARYDLKDQLLAALKRGVPRKELAKEAGITLQQLQDLVRLPDEDGTRHS
jgi:hypothetical protein